MTNYFISTLTIFCVLSVIISCDRPACENTNEVFLKHAPQTKPYKDELVRQLKLVDQSKLSYWMGSYQEHDNLQYVNANIQGEGLCAIVAMAVSESDKGIERILKNKGMGYIGAELKGLKFDIHQDSMSTELVFRSVESIID